MGNIVSLDILLTVVAYQQWTGQCIPSNISAALKPSTRVIAASMSTESTVLAHKSADISSSIAVPVLPVSTNIGSNLKSCLIGDD